MTSTRRAAILALFMAAGAALLGAGCGARVAADAPVVTYYYVPG